MTSLCLHPSGPITVLGWMEQIDFHLRVFDVPDYYFSKTPKSRLVFVFVTIALRSEDYEIGK